MFIKYYIEYEWSENQILLKNTTDGAGQVKYRTQKIYPMTKLDNESKNLP